MKFNYARKRAASSLYSYDISGRWFGEINSLPLIKSIDKSVKEIKQDLYEYQRAAEQRLSNLERDTAELKNITSKLQNEVQEMKSDIKELRIEMQGNVKTLSTQILEVHKRIDDTRDSQNKWFMLLGFLVTAVPIVIAIVQRLMPN